MILYDARMPLGGHLYHCSYRPISKESLRSHILVPLFWNNFWTTGYNILKINCSIHSHFIYKILPCSVMVGTRGGGGLFVQACPLITSNQLHCQSGMHDLMPHVRQSGHLLVVMQAWGKAGQISPRPYSSQPWFVPAPATTEQPEPSLQLDQLWSMSVGLQMILIRQEC